MLAKELKIIIHFISHLATAGRANRTRKAGA
jgi:hypothetical protein